MSNLQKEQIAFYLTKVMAFVCLGSFVMIVVSLFYPKMDTSTIERIFFTTLGYAVGILLQVTAVSRKTEP